MHYIDYAIYLWLRRYMDFSTGIVGLKRRISYHSIIEQLSIPASGGTNGARPSIKTIRCSFDRQCTQGLLEKIEEKQTLVFKMPLALTTKAQVAPKSCPQEVGQTWGRPRADQVGQTWGRPEMSQPCDSQVATMYNYGQTSGDEKQYEVGQTSDSQKIREGKGETPLQTPLAGAPASAPVAEPMPAAAQTGFALENSANEPAAESMQGSRSENGNHQTTQKNSQESPAKTPRKPRQAKDSSPSPSLLALPDWIDPLAWHDYEAHRKGLRKPLVNGSINHVLRDLEKLRAQGHDPNAVLSQSIVRGWVGVFPLAGEHQCQTFVPGNRASKPDGIDLGPSGRSTRDAAERWLNNSNSIENAQENPEP